jgi:xylulokinase
VHGITRRAHETRRGDDGAAEQDPADWWRGVAAAVAELGSTRQRVVAVCAVGQGPTLVAVDAGGTAIRPAITWMDTRPARHVADDPDGVAGFTLRPAIHWLAAREAAAVARSRWLLTAWDWLALRLSGVAAASLQPGEEALVVAGLEDRLPPAIPVGHALGPISAEAAEALGLPFETVVVAGTNDGAATFAGAGLREPGDAVDVGGASGGLAILAAGPVDLPGVYSAPSLLPGRWILGGAMMAIGASFDWLRRVVLGDRVTAEDLFAEAERAAPGLGGLIFLPYLSGERSPIWDEDARGVFVGLRIDHDRGALVRAVLEGGALALRHVAAPIAEAGTPIRELRLSGRPATSRTWSQIKADVLGVPAVIPDVLEASVLGAAMLAAVGAGLLSDLDAAAAAMHHEQRRLKPRPETRATYDDLFRVYLGLYPELRDTFAALARLRAQAGNSEASTS